jgi:hypothetical protein
VVQEYTSEEIENKIQIELVTEEYTDIEGQLLVVNRSELDNRRVDYFIRIFNGEIQERRDYYDNGRLFHSEDWSGISEVGLKGGKVKIYPGTGNERRDPVDWAKDYSSSWLYEHTTEIWVMNKKDHDQGT